MARSQNQSRKLLGPAPTPGRPPTGMSVATDIPRNAVIYVRISKDRENETSTATQRAEANDYCKRKGWTIVGVESDEGRSAFKANARRPGYDRAMSMIETGAADVLVVWRLDRFARGIVSFWEQWRRIDSAGGELVSVTEDLDTTKVVGKILVGLIAGFAEMESEAKSERISSWHEHRRARGDVPTGPAPYGYRRVGTDLIVQPVEADEIRAAVASLLAGGSFQAALRMLNQGSRARKWSTRGVQHLLQSPTLAGLRSAPDGALLPGSWEPILDRESWQAVNALLDDPARRTSDTNQRRWLLVGLGECARCRVPLKSKSHDFGSRYVCRTCGQGAPAAAVDALVGAAVTSLVDRKAWNSLRKAAVAPAIDVEALEAELAELAEQYAAGDLSLDEWRIMRAGITKRTTGGTQAGPVELPDVDDLAKSWDAMPIEAQRLALSAVAKSITLTPLTAPNGPRFDSNRLSIEWAV
jgi:site-specific DNA recombinase